MENSVLYDFLKDFKIDGDYILFCDKENNCYQTDFIDLVNFVEEYFDIDSFICNSDGLCDLIDAYACSYDLLKLVWLFEDLDIYNIENEWFIIDYNFNISFFNDLEELDAIYDIADILDSLLECDYKEDFCVIFPKEEFWTVLIKKPFLNFYFKKRSDFNACNWVWGLYKIWVQK